MTLPQSVHHSSRGSRRHPLAQVVRAHASGRYFWLLLAMVGYMALEPLFVFAMHAQATSVLVFLAALRFTGGGILGRWGTLVLAAVYGSIATIAVASGWHWAMVAAGLTFGVLMLGLVIDGLTYVVGCAEIEADHIFAAICVYLELAFLFAVTYWTIWTLDPKAFAGAGLSVDPHPSELGYFSFMMLTTTGLGDILPATRLTRLLATMEALCGTLYLALMIARLVGMYAQRPRHSSEPHA